MTASKNLLLLSNAGSARGYLADPHSAPWRRRLAQSVAGFMESFMR